MKSGKKNIFGRGIFALAAAALAFAALPVHADIVILKNGTRLEGIVTTSSLVPNVILFSDNVNKSLRIPLSRVEKIVHEDKATSLLRIARAYARAGNYEKALDELRRAKALSPSDPAILEEERSVLRALAVKQAEEAEMKLEETRGLLDKIRKAMENREFEKALAWFELLDREKSLPADLREAENRLKIEFYEKWGDDRADKTDTFGAIECYETVMDLDPNNAGVYEKLMKLYEKVLRPGADETRARKLQEYLEAKVAEDPSNLDARLKLANLLYMRKNWDGALKQYLVLYHDLSTTGAEKISLPRVEARLRALMDGRHRQTAERGDYELAIKQFREYQALFPDADPEPLYRYEYLRKAKNIGPDDDAARIELVRYCEKYGLKNYARKELMTVLRHNPKNPEALAILGKWAQADLREIEDTFQAGLYAQIPFLVSELHKKYPPDRYPTLRPILETADDYVEKARNEARAKIRDRSKRALELAQTGDQNFDRAMTALYNYRNGSGRTYRAGSDLSHGYSVTRTVGSYKADAIMYFQRAKRYYREALALDPTLADPSKQDLRRKISDCDRYLALLTTKRRYRVPAEVRSRHRTSLRKWRPPAYSPYTYPYPYGYPYVRPIQPVWPYGATPPPPAPYPPPPVRR